jgi:FkbM family methyltransferase
MANLKRNVAEKIADILKCFIFPKAEAAAWPEHHFARRLFDRLKPDCVFDIGANVGQYAQSLRQSGFRGQLLSFEPNPVAFEKLQRAASSDASWHCYPRAIGSQVGTMPFHVMKADDFSSFLNPATGENVEFREENVIQRTINVEVTTLDDCLPELQREHEFVNPFLKMDTQGFDLEVIKGGPNVVGKFCGLLSEISIRSIYDGAPDFAESIKAYKSAGFDLAGLYSVHPQLLLKLIEYNCYCVRHDLAQVDEINRS